MCVCMYVGYAHVTRDVRVQFAIARAGVYVETTRPCFWSVTSCMMTP